MGVSWINFGRAYRRTTNLTSRRRMVYLLTGAAAPALGSFPFLLFDSGFALLHPLFFWLTAFLSNLLVGVLLVGCGGSEPGGKGDGGKPGKGGPGKPHGRRK